MKHSIFAVSVLLLTDSTLAESEGFTPICDTAHTSLTDQYKGKWLVDWTYRTAPDIYETTTATSRITDTPGVCGLREHFEGMRDEPYFYEWTTTSLQEAKPEGIWLDSAHGHFLHYTGAEGDNNWPIRFVWNHENGRLQTRLQYSAVEKGGFTIERHLSSDGGQAWALTSKAHYTPYITSAANTLRKSR